MPEFDRNMIFLISICPRLPEMTADGSPEEAGEGDQARQEAGGRRQEALIMEQLQRLTPLARAMLAGTGLKDEEVRTVEQDQRAGTTRPVSFNLLPFTFDLLPSFT